MKAISRPVPELAHLPVSAPELEELVLGAMLQEKEASHIALQILTESDFYMENTRLLYSTMQAMYSRGVVIDIATVTQEARKLGILEKVGGPIRISHLTSRIASTANTETHCRIIRQYSIQRHIASVCHEYSGRAYDPSEDPFDLYDGLLKELTQDRFLPGHTMRTDMSTIAGEALTDMAKVRESGQAPGIALPWMHSNRVLGGLFPGNLAILAARPGNGKTALALALSSELAARNTPVLYLQQEMSAAEMLHRLLAMYSTNSIGSMRRPNEFSNEQWQYLQQLSASISKNPLYIDDSPGLTLAQVRAKINYHIQRYGVKMVVVDYLQLLNLKGEGYNREQEVAAASRTLKGMARSFGIPIIALSQLSRENEKEKRKPRMSDLRESGALEQDADVVLMLYNADKYGLEAEDAEYGPLGKDTLEVIIEKNRQGSAGGSIYFTWQQRTNSFTEHGIHTKKEPQRWDLGRD